MASKISAHRCIRARRLAATVLLGSTILASGHAAAQEAVTEAAEVDPNVILVTSQRRVENLQDVPLSVQVLGQQQLDNLQVTSLKDYVKFLPSVTTQNLGGPFSQLARSASAPPARSTLAFKTRRAGNNTASF